MLRVAPGIQKSCLLLGILAALTSSSLAAGISATATLSETQASAGVYNYALTLNNTGTTSIGTFWFAWVPGAGFLTTTPSSISSPAGWTEINTNAGDAIQWTSTTSLLGRGTVPQRLQLHQHGVSNAAAGHVRRLAHRRRRGRP